MLFVQLLFRAISFASVVAIRRVCCSHFDHVFSFQEARKRFVPDFFIKGELHSQQLFLCRRYCLRVVAVFALQVWRC